MIFRLDLPYLHKLDHDEDKHLIDLMYHFLITNSYCPSPIFSFMETTDYAFLIIDKIIHGAIDNNDLGNVWLSDTLKESWDHL